MAKLTARDVLTAPVRLAFPKLFKPAPKFAGSQDLTYQTVILLPKSTDLRPYTEAAKAAMIEKFGKVVPIPAAKNPIRDCAEKSNFAGYDEEGSHYINLHSTNPVPILAQDGVTPVVDATKIYPGIWVKAWLNAYAWSFNGTKGLSFGLNAIQIFKDGDRLDGRRKITAEDLDMFTPIEGAKTEGGDTSDLFS